MDIDQIDGALHEIEQMVMVSILAQDNALASDTVPGYFQMPAGDAEMLAFAIFDLQKRVKALRTDLYPPEPVKAPVLTLVR